MINQQITCKRSNLWIRKFMPKIIKLINYN